MEGTHGQLGTRLTDGLGGDDADGFAQIHFLGGGQVHAVALGADAHPGAAAQNSANIDLIDPGLFELFRVLGHHHHVLRVEQLPGNGMEHIVDGVTTADAVAEGINDVAILVVDSAHPNTVLSAAVVLPDDHVLGDIHHSTGQVAGVSGTQGRIGHALTGASTGDEILQDGQTLTEVGLNGDLNGTTGGIGHQATHTSQLTNLGHGATGAGVGHHIDGVELVQVALQGVGDVLGGLLPLLHHQTVALVIGNEALAVVVFDLHHLAFRLMDQLVLNLRHHHVRDGHRDSALGGVFVAQGLDLIQHLRGDGKAMAADALINDFAQLLLAHQEADLQVKFLTGDAPVHKAQILGDRLVVDQPAHSGVDNPVLHLTAHFLAVAHQNGGVKAHSAIGVSGNGLIGGGIAVDGTELGFRLTRSLGGLVDSQELIGVHNLAGGQPGIASVGDEHILRALLCLTQTGIGQVVGTQNHILGRHGDGLAVLGPQQVVGGQHQQSGLSLGLGGQGNVNSHLVAVKVGVEGGAAQRMQL